MKNKTFLKYIHVFLLCFITGCYGADEIRPGKNSAPFSDAGIPAEYVVELLAITQTTHDGTMPNIIKNTQEQWIRKPGTERWHINKQDASFHDALHVWLETNNFIHALYPTKNHYTYIIIMGSLARGMQGRVEFTELLFGRGITCDKIIILCGDRPYNPELEAFELYATDADKHDATIVHPATETEIMRYIIDHSSLNRDIIEWYAVPMITTANGEVRRPTTGDTVDLWLAASPAPGSCLVISTNPYAHYQDAVTRTLMPRAFHIETAAPQCPASTTDGSHLDNLARWLYQESKYIEKRLK